MATFEIDGFRMIKSLHTTARQLFVCGGIVTLIGRKQLPKDVLKSLAVDWSFRTSQSNEAYNRRKGKLTEGVKVTTAFDHYIQLCESLNLIVSLNGIYSSSRSAEIYLSLLNQDNNNETFDLTQKVFFIYQLITLDSDGILLALQIVSSATEGLAQKELQNRFKDAFNERLIIKQNSAKDQTKAAISEQYRLLNYTWQKPEKYSEHLLVPRYEWLFDLELVNISKQGGATNYILSTRGKLFLHALPSLDHIKDINLNWLFQSLFGLLAKLYGEFPYKLYEQVTQGEKIQLLGSSLKRFKNVIKLSNSFRYPLHDALLYISIDHFRAGVVTEFNNTLVELRKGFLFEGLLYTVFETGRANESYISIKLTNEI